ncbi:MAG: anti-sigma factor family protein [Candidatus Methylomirabilia bacterium]
MVSCRELVELLGDYLDGVLDSAGAQALGAHLADCQECTAFINTYRGTVWAVRQLREEEIPPQLRERLLAFLDSAMEERTELSPFERGLCPRKLNGGRLGRGAEPPSQEMT